MKRLILALTIFALAASQVPTARAARVFVGVGVGVGGVGYGYWGRGYYGGPYYGHYGYYPRPYWGTGFYSAGYYYPASYTSYYDPTAPAVVQPVQQPQPQPPPQNVTVNNNYYSAPSTPMSGANSLFVR